MRIRSVKPEFWPHRMHKTLSEPAALLALALLNLADDEGRFEADAEAIKSRLFTYRTLSKPVEECLQELARKPVMWILLYHAEIDGEPVRIGQIVNFKRHQVINKFKVSQLPPPPRKKLPDDSGSDTAALPDSSRLEPSSVPSSENSSEPVAFPPSMEGRKEGKGKEGGSAPAPSEPHVPSLEEILDYCAGAVAIDPDYGQRFYEKKAEMPKMWFDPRGHLIDWRRQLLNRWNEDRHTWTPSKKSAAPELGADARAELEVIDAELQWQNDKKRRDELKKRRDELTPPPGKGEKS